MKEGWTYKKLGEVCEVISGQSPEGKYYNTERKGIPFYQGKKDFSLKYIGEPTMWTTDVTKIAEKDDLLMSVRAPVGDVNFATQRLCIGRGLAAIRTKGKVDKEYLFYFLLAKKNNIKGKEGVGFASINRKEIMDIDIHYPDDLSEQLSIVARLDAAFAHVDSLKANAEKQLAEARQLFQAELAECMRPKEGWEEKTLPDISENFDSIRIPVTKKNRTEGKYPYYGASGIVDYVDDYLFDEDLLCISEDGANLLMRTYPIAFPISGKVWVNNHAHVLRFKSLITQKYVEYYFSGLKLDEYITGAAQPKLTQKALNSIIINIPQKIDIQRSIVSHLDALSANIKKLEEVQRKTLAECDALKQAMLREVFE